MLSCIHNTSLYCGEQVQSYDNSSIPCLFFKKNIASYFLKFINKFACIYLSIDDYAEYLLYKLSIHTTYIRKTANASSLDAAQCLDIHQDA